MKKIGLVLSGGGARGAYQVGVISAIAAIAEELNIKNPIKIYTGVSAGAINASFLAAGAHDFHFAAKSLVDLWSHLNHDQVFYSDVASIGKIGFKWMEELSFGALTGTTPGKALLDTAPLHKLITKNLQFELIQQNIQQGHMDAIALSAMDYKTTTTVTFVQGHGNLKMWSKARRHSETAMLQSEHVMASAAIPMLFPPIAVADRYFGDGCIRNSSPCGPAIYMGAEKLIIIGVRKTSETAYDQRGLANPKAPSVARVLNVLLNAVMLDGIELDVERLKRVNEFVSAIPDENRKDLIYKPVDYCFISPSVDIGEIAAAKANRLPRIIRYLLKGLGSLEEASEIISYLLFDPSFCTQLIEIGFEDGMRQKEELIHMMTS